MVKSSLRVFLQYNSYRQLLTSYKTIRLCSLLDVILMWCFGCRCMLMSFSQHMVQSVRKKQFGGVHLIVYHFEVGLLQFASPLLQPLSQHSQLGVLSPQPPHLLFRLWGAALPLHSQGKNDIIWECLWWKNKKQNRHSRRSAKRFEQGPKNKKAKLC